MVDTRGLVGRWKGSRGGHAPGHLRDAFLDYLDRFGRGERPASVAVGYGETPVAPAWLLGQMWNCTDIVPGEAWRELGDYCEEHQQETPHRRTYGAVARWLKSQLRCEAAER